MEVAASELLRRNSPVPGLCCKGKCDALWQLHALLVHLCDPWTARGPLLTSSEECQRSVKARDAAKCLVSSRLSNCASRPLITHVKQAVCWTRNVANQSKREHPPKWLVNIPMSRMSTKASPTNNMTLILPKVRSLCNPITGCLQSVSPLSPDSTRT